MVMKFQSKISMPFLKKGREEEHVSELHENGKQITVDVIVVFHGGRHADSYADSYTYSYANICNTFAF